jgi:hypothetical protein
MDSRRIGGGLLSASGIGLPVVSQMMGLTVSPPIGYALLALCAVLLFGGLTLVFWPRKEKPVATDDQKSVVGWDIKNAGSPDQAAKIVMSGNDPSAVGADVTFSPVAGQNTTGVRIVQDGTSRGPGMTIVQNGAGTGLRITMNPPESPKD